MRTIRVQRTLKAPIEDVFEVLADYEGYVRFPGVRSAKVVRPGSSERNGLGAVREIDLGSAWFREEITAFERPSRLDYHILKSRPSMEHEGGSIRLRPVEGGTEVTLRGWPPSLRLGTLCDGVHNGRRPSHDRGVRSGALGGRLVVHSWQRLNPG
jgi:uncharacterized protein YndB with AHSA1/START domain